LEYCSKFRGPIVLQAYSCRLRFGFVLGFSDLFCSKPLFYVDLYYMCCTKLLLHVDPEFNLEMGVVRYAVFVEVHAYYEIGIF
jgi:hypothetical protein